MALRNKKVNLQQRNETAWGWFFILPTVIGLVILNIYPIIDTIRLSFFKTGDFGLNNTWIGLQNYQRAVRDPEIINTTRNTFVYMLLEVIPSVAISLVLAYLLNLKIKGRTIYRTIFFMPMVAAPAAVAMVWKWLYNTEFGLINNVFNLNISWISDPKYALGSIAIIGIWSILGYNMVLFIGALQEVPKEYYEAATIDGAGRVRQFFKITIPLISPTIYFVLVTRVIGALQVFDTIFMVMEKTNPALNSVKSLVYLFYDYSFIQQNKGYGATIVVLLLIITALLTLFQNFGQKRWVYYN